MNDQPYQIVEALPSFKGRGHSVLQTKLKNLITGNVIAKTIHPRDGFEEADIEKEKAKFIYASREKFVFSKIDDASKRFELSEEQVGDSAKFLKPDQEVMTILFDSQIVSVELPIKVELKVIEVTPGVKGDRAQGGTKLIVLETGAQINAPLFIEEGDVIELNTQRGEYVRRV